MNIRKVKFTPKIQKVDIEWDTEQGPEQKDRVSHSLPSFDPPHPDFIAALESLISGVLNLLGLEPMYREGMEVRGVTFAWMDDEHEGAVITCLKELQDLKTPLVLNTPLFPLGITRGLSEDKLDHLRAEARRYIQGKRAQGDLFEGEGEGGGAVPPGRYRDADASAQGALPGPGIPRLVPDRPRRGRAPPVEDGAGTDGGKLSEPAPGRGHRSG